MSRVRWGGAVVLMTFIASWGEAAQTVGAAPKEDPATVASRVIKQNFPECKRVTGARRAPDGAIRAKCEGVEYMVFTLFDPKAGKTHELALNCSASKRLLSVSC